MRVAPRIPPAACRYDGRDASRGPVFRRARRTARRASRAALARAAAEPTPVVVLRVEGPIDRSTLAYLDDRLAQAERDGAVVVLQLDTSGTLGEDGARARPTGRRPRRAGARLGRPHAGDRVGRGPAADVRLVARRGRAGVADGTARPARPAAPRGAARRPRDDDPGVARRARQGHGARAHRRAAAGGRRDRPRHRLGGRDVGDRASSPRSTARPCRPPAARSRSRPASRPTRRRPSRAPWRCASTTSGRSSGWPTRSRRPRWSTSCSCSGSRRWPSRSPSRGSGSPGSRASACWRSPRTGSGWCRPRSSASCCCSAASACMTLDVRLRKLGVLSARRPRRVRRRARCSRGRGSPTRSPSRRG